MRSTRGCGSMGAASPAWEAWPLKRPHKGRMLSAMHCTNVQQRQYVITRRIQPDSKYTVLYDSMYEYVRVCTSIYAHVQVCASMYQYNQGLQIFMVCTYLFVIFSSNIQYTVLRRRISAFINNRKSIEGMTKFIHKIKCICLDILSTWAYIRRCKELPAYFFFTLFFHFWLHHTMYSHGVPEHMFKHDKKSHELCPTWVS